MDKTQNHRESLTIDLDGKNMKGYCTKATFKAQIAMLKQVMEG